MRHRWPAPAHNKSRRVDFATLIHSPVALCGLHVAIIGLGAIVKSKALVWLFA